MLYVKGMETENLSIDIILKKYPGKLGQHTKKTTTIWPSLHPNLEMYLFTITVHIELEFVETDPIYSVHS